MSENGFCLWEGLQRDGGWGLLRSVGLTPSSAPQPPPPVKGTFLFGERRGHFYRWTTSAPLPSPISCREGILYPNIKEVQL